MTLTASVNSGGQNTNITDFDYTAWQGTQSALATEQATESFDLNQESENRARIAGLIEQDSCTYREAVMGICCLCGALVASGVANIHTGFTRDNSAEALETHDGEQFKKTNDEFKFRATQGAE